VTTGAARTEVIEKGQNEEDIMLNNDAENTEEDGYPIERGKKQQQHADTVTDKVPASSLICEGNQYAEDESVEGATQGW
jgi:hypothetical protein